MASCPDIRICKVYTYLDLADFLFSFGRKRRYPQGRARQKSMWCQIAVPCRCSQRELRLDIYLFETFK